MENTQNEKISQIKFSTLVVGIDVAKEIHYARAFDFRGIELSGDVYQELREVVSERDRLVQRMSSISNQVIRWLDIHFPEFNTILKDWRRQAAMQILRNFPTPDKIVAAGAVKIEETWKLTMKRTAGLKRAQELVKVAGASIGRKTGLVAAEASLQNLLNEHDLYSHQYQQLEQLMMELLQQVPNAEKLLDIKRVGLITAATFVGEVGDIRRFQDPRQIQKLAGFNLVENSSGKHKGKTRISRRGRRRLSHGLFIAMITILATNPEFRQLHKKNISRENNPLNKMQSIIALCVKLIRVFYALLRTGTDYSAEKMLVDIELGMKAAA